MKIALAQLNPVVGDLNGNAFKIKEKIEISKQEGAQLVVFPEMSLTGYPPRDLLLYDSFVNMAMEAVYQDILPAVKDVSVVLGTPWREEGLENRKEDSGKGLYNAALFLQEGQVVSTHLKTLLPQYDVFDESRYFNKASELALAEIGGKKIAITVCEDIWNDKDYFLEAKYPQDPVASLFEQGAEALINISASPYHFGKATMRADMLSALAQKYNAEIIYVNQVGGNDELIFDGSSMVYSPGGELIYRAKPFAEELALLEDGKYQKTAFSRELPGEVLPESNPPRHVESPPPDAKVDFREDMGWVLSALKLGLKDYLDKVGFSKVAVGLSGGIDSALVLAIACEVLGPANALGVMMPSRYSSDHSVQDSKLLAQNLGIETRLISIENPHNEFIKLLNDSGQPILDLAEENLQARIRGNIMMFISNREGWMILPTGNKSELAVGYCTLYGDMCGGLAILADLPKTMVYRLSSYINWKEGREVIPENIINKAPSAELRPDQKDQDSLPPYETLDQILYYYIEENKYMDEIVEMGFDIETVKDVINKVNRSEYKRAQAAPGLRVTTRAFGSGRKMPTAMKIPDVLPQNRHDA